MCGIVGVAHRDPDRAVSPRVIEAMCATIRHRGPDDDGVFVDGSIGLGMRRLSIIDLDGSKQPVFNEDRSKAIMFNGEIYNYKELRRGLVSRGHTFRTAGDTETIVHLYEELGARCVERLRGMFAFAIWDATSRELLLARDRFGIKPLYVATRPWGIAFASELKALTALGMTDRRLDWSALDTFLQLGYIPAPQTPFDDVIKLEPGHTFLWSPTRAPVVTQYWDHPRGVASPPTDPPAQVRSWLDESVEAHMVSDVPVAAFLSGGLDSSSVVASMAQFQQRPHAFTVRYHGSGARMADETPLAERLTDRYGAQLSIIDVRPQIASIFEPIVRALDEPHADDSAIPTWLISEAVGSQYKVALTGIGGDELFAGYRRHLGLLYGGYYHKLPLPLRMLIHGLVRRLREPRSAGLAVNRLKRFVASTNGATPDRFLDYLTRIRDAERALLYAASLRDHIGSDAARRRFRALYETGGRPTGLNAGLYLDYKTFLPDDILALSDRLSMAHSLEVRVPLVDHPLVDAVFPLPDGLKIGRWTPKHLLRRALRPRLPDAHFSAPKRGFVGPTAAWLRDELRQPLVDELAPDRMRRLGYFEPTAVQALLDEHFSRRHNREGVLWALLCFSTWHRLYLESETPSPYPGATH